MPGTLPCHVAVSPAAPHERPLVEGLFQFYAYDFSEFAAPDSPDFDFDASGRFAPYAYLDSYWREEGRVPLLIRIDGRLAGFALLNRHSHRGGAIERNMAEFFVARRFRRRGVAQEALRRILADFPGAWEIAVSERNTGALAFWPRAIAAAGIAGVARVEGDGTQWRGPIYCFRA
ncbi:MAG: GNAT family N-acetyltransferase [Alphaproteobacteria bacterium]|nr:GNAT family N-acetyltransferase [Alphaproteobacteria bacterium]